MKTIIVPIDFSEISINAASYALGLATIIKAEVILLHVVTLPVIIEVPVSSASFEVMKNEAIDELEQLKVELSERAGNSINISARVSIGNLLDEVAEVSHNSDAFAIVIGIKIAGAAERILFGSNVFTLMNKLSVPVIIIPEHAIFNNIIKIALALDMKEIPEKGALKMISTMINLFNGKLDILFVSKNKNINTATLHEYAKLQKSLAKFHPKFHHLINNEVGEGVLQFMQKEKTDLLLVLPKKHGFVDGLFHKSISKELAMHCSVPVMTINN